MRKSILFGKIFCASAPLTVLTAGVMALLASLCVCMLLVFSLDYTKNFDRLHEAQNGADNVFVFSAADREAFKKTVSEKLDAREGIEAYDFMDVQPFWGGCKYGEGIIQSIILPARKSEAVNKKIGRYTIVTEDSAISGVYLPYSFYAGKYYGIGDDFTITDNSVSETMKVAGFYYSTMTDSQNCYMTAILLDGEVFERFAEKFTSPGVMISVRTSDGETSSVLEREFSEEVQAAVPGAYFHKQNSVGQVRKARYASYYILLGLIGVAAIVLLVLTSVSLNVNLSNYIREKRKTIGILKAVGHTDGTIGRPVICLFLLVTAVGACLGTAAFYGAFRSLNRFFEEQIGLPYEIRFMPAYFAGTVLILLADVFLAAYFSLRPVKRIAPMETIRSEASVRSGKSFGFSLKKTGLPLNLALSVNDILARKKQNTVIAVTVLLSSMTLAAVAMLFHVAAEAPDRLSGMLFGESCDVSAVVPADRREAFEEELEKDGDVTNYYTYDILTADHEGGARLTALIVGAPDKLRNKDIYYEGDCPETPFQVAVGGKYAEDNGISVGDSLRFSAGGEKAEFTVCGFSQSVRYLGNECSFTREGYERMQKLYTNQYFIDLKKDVNRQEKTDMLREMPITLSAADAEAYRIGTLGKYIDVVKLLSGLLGLLCLTAMTFVMYYVTAEVMKTKEKYYGIMRALGFTTKDLIVQAILVISVPAAVAAAAGILMAGLLADPLTLLFIKRVGIVKNCFAAPVSWLAAAGAGQILAVLLPALALSMRIRRMAPRNWAEG